MPDFSRRSTGPELMDDLHAKGRDLHQALHELESINYLLGGNYVTLNGVTQLLENTTPGSELHIADLGCGSGDMLKLVRRLLEKQKLPATLTGIDANPNVISFATSNTPAACRIRYQSLDILSQEFRDKRFDIVIATLFFHHFTDEQLIRFFKQLKGQVTTGMIINDIHRLWFSYYAIKWLTKFFSRSPMVKHDAPVSVLRGFRKHELKKILREAGIRNYKIKWRWAFRWQVVVRF
jgi:ubiquinone/menaquinone biosynthesis C-methylase UbiE